MKFLKNIFKSDKENSKETPELGLGEFDLNDFPKEDRGKSFYFDKYAKQDGEWVDINEPICTIRIGDRELFQFSAFMCKAKKAGVLEWTSEENEELTNGKVFYKLHPKGEYQNENCITNSEFKEYFQGTDFWSFDKWLVSDGDYVEIGEPIFQYKDRDFQKHTNHSKKAGFVHQIDPAKIFDLKFNELMYTIRESDEVRVNERFVNKPNIIKDCKLPQKTDSLKLETYFN